MKAKLKNISVKVRVVCDECNGGGLNFKTNGHGDSVPCEACGGLGVREAWLELSQLVELDS